MNRIIAILLGILLILASFGWIVKTIIETLDLTDIDLDYSALLKAIILTLLLGGGVLLIGKSSEDKGS